MESQVLQNQSQQRQWSMVMSQEVQVTLCRHPHTLLPSKLSLIILLDLQQRMAAHDSICFSTTQFWQNSCEQYLDFSPKHQGSTYSCTDCSLDALFGLQESMYRLANQQDHRYGPTERKAVIVSADGRNMLRRQLANSSSIPVQGL
jgi:hypothetical protein